MMMNSTLLLQIDGGQRIKQGDTSSRFEYQLSDEHGQPIPLEGQAEIKLLSMCENGSLSFSKISKKIEKAKTVWKTTSDIVDSKIAFVLDILPIGTYEVEVSAGGYIFPSDHSVKIHVVKSEKTYLTSELKTLKELEIAEVISAQIKALGLEGVSDERIVTLIQANLPKSVDAEQVKEIVQSMNLTEELTRLFNAHTAEIGKKLDSEQVQGLIKVALDKLEFPKFDPTDILNKLSDLETSKIDSEKAQELIRASLASLPTDNTSEELEGVRGQIKALSDKVENLTDNDTIFDPSEINSEISEIKSSLEAIKASGYDDTALTKRIEALESKPEPQFDTSSLATKQELEAVKETIPAQQDLSEYALKSELPNVEKYVDKETLTSALDLKADKSSLSDYALKSDLPQAVDLTPLEGRISSLEGRVDKDTIYNDTELRSEISGVSERVTNLENKPAQEVDLSNYATKSEIPNLEGYALKSELPTMPNLDSYALKSDIPTVPNIANLATKEELSGKADKSQLPDFSLYALKSEIPSGGGGGTATPQPVQDTGWRKLSSSNLTDGYILFRRVGNSCYVTCGGGMWGTFSTRKDGQFQDPAGVRSDSSKIQLTARNGVPNGFKTSVATMSAVFTDGGAFVGMFLLTSAADQSVIGIRGPGKFVSSADTRYFRMPIVSYVSTDPFPSEEDLKGLVKV